MFCVVDVCAHFSGEECAWLPLFVPQIFKDLLCAKRCAVVSMWAQPFALLRHQRWWPCAQTKDALESG